MARNQPGPTAHNNPHTSTQAAPNAMSEDTRAATSPTPASGKYLAVRSSLSSTPMTTTGSRRTTRRPHLWRGFSKREANVR